jgi:cold shock CspA family protein
MQTGKVKRLVTDRGFGFITGEGGGDVFFHFSACYTRGGIPDPRAFEHMKAGDTVEYTVDKRSTDRAHRASTVVLVARAHRKQCAVCDAGERSVKAFLCLHGRFVCDACAAAIHSRLAAAPDARARMAPAAIPDNAQPITV